MHGWYIPIAVLAAYPASFDDRDRLGTFLTSETTFWTVDTYLAGLDACALQDMLDADVEGGLSLSACVLHADVHLLVSAPHNLCTARTALAGRHSQGSHPNCMHACTPALLPPGLCKSHESDQSLLATECLYRINDTLWHSMCAPAWFTEVQPAPVPARILQQPAVHVTMYSADSRCVHRNTISRCLVSACLKWCSADGTAHCQAGLSDRSGLRCPAPTSCP